ncbi:MAG: phosphohexomutase domain-containing protein [Pirellulaceae bacterium]
MSIFKSCDVRGIVGEEWSVDDARRIGQGLGYMLRTRSQSQIVVGGDFRRSTNAFKSALIEGLRQRGVCVVDVGQVPTPVVPFAARQIDCPNLAIITASHNPGKYNGIKFLVDGRPPIPELMSELQRAMEILCSGDAAGSLVRQDVLADYEAWLIPCAQRLVATAAASRESAPSGDAESGSRVTADSNGRAASMSEPGSWPPRRVAVDPMGGAFTGIAPRVLKAAGYEVVTVDAELDPDFQRRDPNPANDRNLRPLAEATRHNQADLGVALDGDGDRVILVDAGGRIARPEQIAALLVEHWFPGSTVVFDLKCASLVPRTVQAQEGRAVMQPSGHGFIKTAMLERRAELGVEVSGHHFFGALEGGDDGLFTALVVLTLLRRLNLSLHGQLERIGWPHITPDLRLPLVADCRATLETIAGSCGGQVSRMDGVRAEYEDGWGLARASITEPAITFRFEGRDPTCLRQVVARFLSSVPVLRHQVLERI